MKRVQIPCLKYGPSSQLLDGTSELLGPTASVIIFRASSPSGKRSGGSKSKHQRGCRSVSARPQHLVALRPHRWSPIDSQGSDRPTTKDCGLYLQCTKSYYFS